jgi:large subunit ribosomal protein L21
VKILGEESPGKITQYLPHSYLVILFTFNMVSYAIVEACGKQFWVEEGRFYDFNKLPLNKGDTFSLNNILLVNLNNNIKLGKPFVDDVKIDVTVLRHISGPKVRVYKMRPKKKTRKTFGSRPKLTRVLINTISEKVGDKVLCYL